MKVSSRNVLGVFVLLSPLPPPTAEPIAGPESSDWSPRCGPDGDPNHTRPAKDRGLKWSNMETKKEKKKEFKSNTQPRK